MFRFEFESSMCLSHQSWSSFLGVLPIDQRVTWLLCDSKHTNGIRFFSWLVWNCGCQASRTETCSCLTADIEEAIRSPSLAGWLDKLDVTKPCKHSRAYQRGVKLPIGRLINQCAFLLLYEYTAELWVIHRWTLHLIIAHGCCFARGWMKANKMARIPATMTMMRCVMRITDPLFKILINVTVEGYEEIQVESKFEDSAPEKPCVS